uniref:Uncharacterized protein n=1 Tax=Arundo donax TaxID=35708 RepID=A0A0A9U3Q9_ARUDO
MALWNIKILFQNYSKSKINKA